MYNIYIYIFFKFLLSNISIIKKMLYEENETKLRFILFHAFSRRQWNLPTYKNIKNNTFILWLMAYGLSLSSEKSVKQISKMILNARNKIN